MATVFLLRWLGTTRKNSLNLNPMNKILIVIAGFGLALFSGCAQTPQQLVADGVYASGYATAYDNLNLNPNLVAVVQDVAAKLPTITSASLTDADRGKLAGEIKLLASNTTLLKSLVPADSQKLDTAFAYFSGALTALSATTGGKAPTVDQQIANTAIIQFANGLLGGVGYWQGVKSVPTVPPPSA